MPTAEPNTFDPLIELHASRSRLSPELVRAVVQIESGFDPTARSSAGAMACGQETHAAAR